MNILISGASGEIGGQIANNFSKNKNYNLYLIGNKNRKKNIKIYKHDLTKILKINFKPDVIIHLAAKHLFSKKGSKKNIYHNNIKMTKNLITFANEKKIKKFIFFSSVDVYGKITSKIINENTNKQYPNSYGRSKLESEKMLLDKNNKFSVVCYRIPGFFSTNLSRDFPLIVKIARTIINNKKLKIFNSSSKFNNILDLKEILKILKISIKKNGYTKKIYNLSASKPMKFIEIIYLLKKNFKSSTNLIEKKSTKKSFIISNRKFSKEFNFKFSSTKNIINRCCSQILKKKYA